VQLQHDSAIVQRLGLLAAAAANSSKHCSCTLSYTHIVSIGMQAAYDLLWGPPGVAATVRSVQGCENMTNADLISIAGYVAVVQANGSAKGGCGWYPGRYHSAILMCLC
jgi:hypothetical protein